MQKVFKGHDSQTKKEQAFCEKMNTTSQCEIRRQRLY